MRVAGIGLRTIAEEASLVDALDALGGTDGLDALACLDEKAGAPQLISLATRLGLPIIPVTRDALAGETTLSRSQRVENLFGTGSVAEAAALAACGPGARLVAPRSVSPDRMATAAIAVSGDIE
ncbi:MAG: precorrin methylase [Hyphomicrobiales bacterium]|nr:MAG: precorrin methylase [Hyphomicrobiales bacterium]